MPNTIKQLPRISGIILVLLALAPAAAAAEPAVKMWQQPLVIPTYPVGPPQKNPIFYSGRSYQGAKGPIYPYPLYDTLSDTKVDKTYQAIYLENKYVQFTILPELGGRIFSGRDKTNNYDFIYRQHVIKPALIGMIGAWISGGVEWNIPHHHRASTFMPVDYKMVENPDGSKTVWVGEIELRHRMKWLVGMTLYGDRSYLEVTVKLINRTPLPHSILYFANIAVHANENYQVIFPPGTEYGTQHGKKEFVHWPIGQERYGGVDRTGVDVTWWKNNPTPVSIFAWNYDDDWFGGYDHGKQAGIVSFADHHVAPGKKFFEWGNGPEGRMWEKLLTDSDGPYLELMAGAWSDNQPDYSWIQPYETKTVKQYFYPVRELGGVKAANLDAAVNLEVDEKGVAKISINTTRKFAHAKVLLATDKQVFLKKETSISPEKPFRDKATVPPGVKVDDLEVSLMEVREPPPKAEAADTLGAPQTPEERVKREKWDGIKRVILAYRPARPRGTSMPKPVEPPPAPKDIKTNEELYLVGLRLEQFCSPALEPYPYYEEALKRDPGDYRVNTALGILYLKRGMYAEAEQRFNAAIERATQNYTKPKEGEAYYYLGVALKAQNKLDAAENAFQKAAWSHAWNAAANCALAEVTLSRGVKYAHEMPGRYAKALDFLDRSLARNAENTNALALKAFVLVMTGRYDEAQAAARSALALDPLDRWAARGNAKALWYLELDPDTWKGEDELAREMPGAFPSYLDLAADYAACGFFGEAQGVLARLARRQEGKEPLNPLVPYHTAYYCGKMGMMPWEINGFGMPRRLSPDYCFPWQLESADVLRRAIEVDPKDARAPYYLGNLLFDLQPEKAIEAWEESRKRDDKFATVHRNLGLAYAQVQNDLPKAVASMERAVACDPKDPKLYAELDVLYEAAGTDHPKRLAILEKNREVVAQRDDSLLREVRVDLLVGKYDRAIEILGKHHFRLWEGETGLHDLYVDAYLLRGQKRFKAGDVDAALADYKAALEYPENLETARAYRGESRAPQVYYLMGTIYEVQGSEEARRCFQQAVERRQEGSENSYYQALAYRKLGQEAKAAEMLDGLMRAADTRLKAPAALDFFAKFGTRQSEAVRKAQAHYLLGLGYLGQGKKAEAKRAFEEALRLNINHLWAQTMLAEMQ
jgi:tetratricopeptide (TPR) repeat protein